MAGLAAVTAQVLRAVAVLRHPAETRLWHPAEAVQAAPEDWAEWVEWEAWAGSEARPAALQERWEAHWVRWAVLAVVWADLPVRSAECWAAEALVLVVWVAWQEAAAPSAGSWVRQGRSPAWPRPWVPAAARWAQSAGR